MTTDQIIADIVKYIKQNNDFLGDKNITAPLEVNKNALLNYLQNIYTGFSDSDLQNVLNELNGKGWIAASGGNFVAFDPAVLSF